MNPSRVVFCDFDGTITTEDTFVKVLEKFAPEAAACFLPSIFRREITLKEGIHKTLGSVPSIHYPEIIDFISLQPVRPGLKELLDFLNDADVPFVVISGGLTDMVKAVLEQNKLQKSIKAVYAGEVDLEGGFLRPYCKIEGDTEFVAKVKAMDLFPAQEQIAIGDSVTDINMALAADLVFARDRLTEYLDIEHKAYLPWQDFFEIRDCLAARWHIDL